MFHYLCTELQRVINTSVFLKWRILASSIKVPLLIVQRVFVEKREQKSAIF